jgi:imidazolonepropionase-like amidohydrolase
LESLLGGRTVTYNWPCRIGVSFNRDCLNGGFMSDHPTALGATCSGRFAALRELFKMRHLCACLTVIELAGALAARAQDAPAKPLAITSVTVIDATGAPARPDMTVIVTGDRITAVGKFREVGVPEGARVVDGKGKYLIPGLWDMHVHTADPSFLPLYLANGVTGVRDMHAMDPDAIFRLRKQVEEGKLPGPRIVAAGPLVDGPRPFVPGSLVAANAAEGREAVRKLKKMGADFVKVYTKLPREAYLSIADEAKKQGLPFVGHVPESVSAAEASDLGQKSIEHLGGVELACSDSEDELRREAVAVLAKAENQAAWDLLARIGARAADSFSDNKARALYTRFVRNGTWQVPTLTVLRSFISLDDPKFTADPRVKYMPPSFRSYWSLIKLSPETSAGLKRRYRRATGLVRAMHQAGVPFLAGTDTPGVPCVFPGFSLHDELAQLVAECGFTPLEALQAATRDPARFLGREKDLGTVEPGKLADLVVLDADPLADIHNTTKIAAVVMNGKLLPRNELDKMLAEVEAANKKK